MRIEVQPFTGEHLPDAGRLLADRHVRHLAHDPLLSPRYIAPAVAEAEVAAVLAQRGASGAVAAVDGTFVGYLLGAPKASAAWGDNVWVESAGFAATDAEVVRELYAAASQRWVDEGRLAQYVLTPAHDQVLEQAWFRLAFGHQHTHAIQPTHPVSLVKEVRRAGRGDIQALAEIDCLLGEHQAVSPTFSSGPLDTVEERLVEWEEDITDEEFTTFVYEAAGEVVGSATGCALSKSSSHTSLARPDNAAFLGFAAVRASSRGLGVGRALGETVIGWAHDAGYSSIVTDWRETNLLSSRAWRGLGFRDSFHRLHRLVGH